MMTPEEIQQVVEDYKKSNSLNEIFNDKTMNFLRNFGRNPKDKVNIDKDKEKNGNGAQGATNGAQGAQSSTSGAQGAQGAQSNDNVGAQGNGAQSSSTGAQGAQSNDNVGAQGATNGAQGNQGAETNTVKKNEIDLDAIKKYSRNNREITIKDLVELNQVVLKVLKLMRLNQMLMINYYQLIFQLFQRQNLVQLLDL